MAIRDIKLDNGGYLANTDDIGYDDEGEVMFGSISTELPFDSLIFTHSGLWDTTETCCDGTGFDDLIVATELVDPGCETDSTNLKVVNAIRGGGSGTIDEIHRMTTDGDNNALLAGYFQHTPTFGDLGPFTLNGNTSNGKVDYFFTRLNRTLESEWFVHGGGSAGGGDSSMNLGLGIAYGESAKAYGVGTRH